MKQYRLLSDGTPRNSKVVDMDGEAFPFAIKRVDVSIDADEPTATATIYIDALEIDSIIPKFALMLQGKPVCKEIRHIEFVDGTSWTAPKGESDEAAPETRP